MDCDYTQIKTMLELNIAGLAVRIESAQDYISKQPDGTAKDELSKKLVELEDELVRNTLCKGLLSGTTWEGVEFIAITMMSTE